MSTRPRVLYLTTVYPGHRRTGGDVCSQDYIDGLKRSDVEVDVVCFLRPGDPWPSDPSVHVVEQRAIESAQSGFWFYLWMLICLLRGTPYSAEKYRSSRYRRVVSELLARHRYPLCILDHASRLSWMLPELPPDLPVVANTHNIEHLLYEGLQRKASRPINRWVYAREARLVKVIELDLAAKAAEVWTVTPVDGAFFSGLPSPPRVRAFETAPAHFTPPRPLPPKRYDVGLLGNWQWHANLEGLQWFVDEVLPAAPELQVELAGNGADWLREQSPRLRVRGFVEDGRHFLCEARVIAIPSTSGAGVQIKTLEAIALGMPVVATTIAVRGLSDLPSTVQLADDPYQFAALLRQAVARPSAGPEPAALAWAARLRGRHQQLLDEALSDFGVTGRASSEQAVG